MQEAEHHDNANDITGKRADVVRKEWEETEQDAPEFSGSFAERMEQLDAFYREHATGEMAETGKDALEALMEILDDMLDQKPSASFYRRNYEGWSDDDILRFRFKVAEVNGGLLDKHYSSSRGEFD